MGARALQPEAASAVVVRDPSLPGASELLERVALSGVGVIVQGEAGTGKEVLARTLHALSRRPGELVAINCAALPVALLESELFGHERGAIAGADHAKPGLLELAGHGTVLLDEVGELPRELQAALLRALEARKVYRVGGVAPIDVHARVIAASQRALPELVARGALREDLYHRLAGITLVLEPLRERRSQIALLAQEFLVEVAREVRQPTTRLTAAALAALEQYDWPGNVRELRGVVARAALLAGAAPIEARHLLLEPRPRTRSEPPAPREGFLAVAREHRGNASAIARALSTSRSQVRRLASRFAVDLDRLRRGGHDEPRE